MAPPDLGHVEDLVTLLRCGQAPVEVRRFAARGVLPLDVTDQLRALLVVLRDPDPAVAATARATLDEIPPDSIAWFLGGPDVTDEELDTVASRTEDVFVLERIIQHRNVSDSTLAALARTVTGSPQETLIVNQARLLKAPALIDALFDNPGLTADGRRRLNELKEEFFEKESRRRRAPSRRKDRPLEVEIPLASDETTGAGESDGDESGPETGAAETAVGEGNKESGRGAEELYIRIMKMTVPERVKLALRGNREERRLLIADGSKMVGLAVLRARGLTITEVEGYCAMRHLDYDIFLKIATTRDWIRRAVIALALVKNPKVPLSISLPLIPRLPMRELKNIARDRNLPEAVRVQARRTYLQRRR